MLGKNFPKKNVLQIEENFFLNKKIVFFWKNFQFYYPLIDFIQSYFDSELKWLFRRNLIFNDRFLEGFNFLKSDIGWNIICKNWFLEGK